MIVIHLMGGLGNQLFQAAAGIALSKIKSEPLAFYFDDAYKLAKRGFALYPFNIEYCEASFENIKNYLPRKGVDRRLRQLFGRSVNGKLYREKDQFRYDKDLFNLPSQVYLSGFWQSYKYFEKYRTTILQSFSLTFPPTGENLAMSQKIKASTNSVSIHLRRGDYANPQSGFYILPVQYYTNAIKILEKKFDHLNLFVFSDDPKWVKENFKTKYQCTFIDNNSGDSAHEDLRLMSLCKNNIIANSSLSWWGAYLNKNSEKIVIAPDKWNIEVRSKETELIPDSWIVL